MAEKGTSLISVMLRPVHGLTCRFHTILTKDIIEGEEEEAAVLVSRLLFFVVFAVVVVVDKLACMAVRKNSSGLVTVPAKTRDKQPAKSGFHSFLELRF